MIQERLNTYNKNQCWQYDMRKEQNSDNPLMNYNVMEREPIKTLPYNEVKFKFISDHYDVHLNGSCLYENSICEFRHGYRDYGEENDQWYGQCVEIYELNWGEKLKWIWKQWLFEKCVGYHCSYRNGKRGKDFYYRKPKWLYVWIFNRYYGRWRYHFAIKS